MPVYETIVAGLTFYPQIKFGAPSSICSSGSSRGFCVRRAKQNRHPAARGMPRAPLGGSVLVHICEFPFPRLHRGGKVNRLQVSLYYVCCQKSRCPSKLLEVGAARVRGECHFPQVRRLRVLLSSPVAPPLPWLRQRMLSSASLNFCSIC